MWLQPTTDKCFCYCRLNIASTDTWAGATTWPDNHPAVTLQPDHYPGCIVRTGVRQGGNKGCNTVCMTTTLHHRITITQSTTTHSWQKDGPQPRGRWYSSSHTRSFCGASNYYMALYWRNYRLKPRKFCNIFLNCLAVLQNLKCDITYVINIQGEYALLAVCGVLPPCGGIEVLAELKE